MRKHQSESSSDEPRRERAAQAPGGPSLWERSPLPDHDLFRAVVGASGAVPRIGLVVVAGCEIPACAGPAHRRMAMTSVSP
jgi:hypothetical protein